MVEEFDQIIDQFATPRMTTIAPAADGIDDEDLIEREDMVVTVTLAAISSARRSIPFRPRIRAARAAPDGDQG
jgi:DNA gyrase subunit A